MGIGFIVPEFDYIISEINGPRSRVYRTVMQRAHERLEGRPPRCRRRVRLRSEVTDDQGQLWIRASDVLVGLGSAAGTGHQFRRRPIRCDINWVVRIEELIQIDSFSGVIA